MAPTDLFIVLYVRNKMRGQCFSTPEEAVNAFRMHVLEISQSEWPKWENCAKRIFIISKRQLKKN